MPRPILWPSAVRERAGQLQVSTEKESSMTTSDDDLIRDAAVAGKMIAASQNTDLPPFVRNMAAHTAEVITARLSDEHKEGQGEGN